MPLRMMVTPVSLYAQDPTIFDGMQLPTMPSNPTDYPDLYVSGFNLDRDVLVDNLLMELGEMDVIYTDPAFMKFAITQWSKKELPVWQELYNTLFYKYNPLWNKDGTIKESAEELRDLSRSEAVTRNRNLSEGIDGDVTESGTTENQRTTSDTRTNTGTVQDSGSNSHNTTHGGTVTTSGTSEIENKVSAYNASTYDNKDKSDTTNSETVTDASTIAESGTDGNTRTDNLREELDGSIIDAGTSSRRNQSTQDRDLEEEETESISGTDEGSVSHSMERTEQGNIGVTMTTQLIEAQRALVQLNFYDLIIESFKHRFCILLY